MLTEYLKRHKNVTLHEISGNKVNARARYTSTLNREQYVARVDMEFLFKYLIRVLTSEMSSWTREEKFYIYKQPCINLFII